MCIFSTDFGAVRSARKLLEELPQFNRKQNLLRTPLQIRCGVSAGEIAIEQGMPLGNSPESSLSTEQRCCRNGLNPGDFPQW